MRDLIVLIPGIMGSVLQKDGKDLFALSWSAGWSALISGGSSLQQMVLSGDDSCGKDLGDGITATRLMSDAHLIPGFFKIDGYGRISEFIKNNFDVIQGDVQDQTKPANYFEFPYDWRRDNKCAALKLETLINQRLPQWQESSGHTDAKVVLIGHSMGGLVSRYYLEVLEGWKKCRALITFGTPYRGSINALDFLANGYKKKFIDLTDVLRSFTSTYQLLPVYKVVDINGEYQRIEDTVGITGVDPKKAAEARLEFHEAIRRAVEAHQKDADYLKSYKIVPIVGTRQPTLQSASFVAGKLTASYLMPSKDEADSVLAEGDGTVPRLSATPYELSDEYRETFFAERHASLQNNDAVLTDLLNRLGQMQINLKKFLGSPPSPLAAAQPAIGLHLDDMYLADEPVVMRAKLINVSKQQQDMAPTARISQASSSGQTIERNFQQVNGEWELVCEPLIPGQYRVEVFLSEFAAGAPSPVHDIFEVHS